MFRGIRKDIVSVGMIAETTEGMIIAATVGMTAATEIMIEVVNALA